MGRPKFPRLSILRTRQGAQDSPLFQGYDVELNGHRLDHLRRLSLYLDHEDVNICRLEFIVGEVAIDADVMAMLGGGPEHIDTRVAGEVTQPHRFDPMKKTDAHKPAGKVVPEHGAITPDREPAS